MQSLLTEFATSWLVPAQLISSAGGTVIAVVALPALSRPLSTRKGKAQVAAISAQNDAMTGDLVADDMERIGSEGVITGEESTSTETTLDVVEGMQFGGGFLSPSFVTNPDRLEAVLETCQILLFDRKISTINAMFPLLEHVIKGGNPLLVIAEDVEAEALAPFIVNNLRGSLRSCVVKAPGFGDRRKAMLPDIATVTAGEVISTDFGLQLEIAAIAQLGRAARGVADKDKTIIIGGAGERSTSKRASRRSRPQLRRQPAPVTPKSFRNGWPGCLAVAP